PDQKGRGAGYHWRYISGCGRVQSYRPAFTYYGFRYVMTKGAVPAEITGSGSGYEGENAGTREEHAALCRLKTDCSEGLLTEAEKKLPVIQYLAGEFIYPDNMISGSFSCSDPLFSGIHRIVTMAMLSNIKSYMTDCPHREKLPWLEQTHLIGPGMLYNFNLRNLYEKIEQDMEDSQRKNGLIPDICPEYVVFGYHEGFVDSPEWGSACILNVWHLYLMYGETMLLERYYTVMRRYLLYQKSRTYGHLLHHGLGDWLDIGPMTPYSQNTPVPLVASAIYYYDLRVMAEMAGILEAAATDSIMAGTFKTHRKEYTLEMEAVYREYNAQFLDEQTNRYANGSQAAQAMSLVAGLVPKEREEKVLSMLVKDIEKRGYATTAGDVGHPFVLAALMKWKRNDVITAMTKMTDKPGYGYQVKCGATTLTEDWDGPDPEAPHGSQNHLMLGSIEEWFYGGLAGINPIRRDKKEELLFCPHFAEGIDEVNAWTIVKKGYAGISWKRGENGKIELELLIPPNSSAVFENEADGSRKLFQSGRYRFEA
ncbi:MAG: hypothetical protein IKN57_10030, partial [Parasporobacterium sp.]|nr:hypothetical protein [Parasporobacterium sp.]